MWPRRPRLRNFDYLGRHRYFLTFCTFDRHRAFVSNQNVNMVRDEILIAAADCRFEIPAYVFMPDHLHLLVVGASDGSDLRAFAHTAKQRSGFKYAGGVKRRLWQPSYYDH